MINKNFRSILDRIAKFRDERDWMQFHTPKDMAEALVIEASELLECFLWKSPDEIKKMLKTKEGNEEVTDEIADILHYLIELADNLGIDLEQASIHKLKKAAKKYPVAKAKGVATKYTKL